EGEFGEGTGGRAVDRLAIHREPRADLLESFDAFRRYFAFGRRADVQQVVASLAGDVDQGAEQRLRALPIAVVALKTPGLVHRHAGLPIAVLKTGLWDLLLGGFRVAAKLGVTAKEPIVRDDRRLELEQLVQLGGPLAVHVDGRVPPE